MIASPLVFIILILLAGGFPFSSFRSRREIP